MASPSNPAPANMLVLLSDNHNRALSGCYGHPKATTPNLDRIAARGVRFANVDPKGQGAREEFADPARHSTLCSSLRADVYGNTAELARLIHHGKRRRKSDDGGDKEYFEVRSVALQLPEIGQNFKDANSE